MSRRNLMIAKAGARYAPTDTVFDVTASDEHISHSIFVTGSTVIDWGDGETTETNSAYNAAINDSTHYTHTYASPGVYTVRISGTYYNFRHGESGGVHIVSRIRQIGNNLYNAENIFSRCSFLTQIDNGCKFSNVTTGSIRQGFFYSGNNVEYPDGFVSSSNLTNFHNFSFGGSVLSFWDTLPDGATDIVNLLAYSPLHNLNPNFRIPASCTVLNNVFDRCSNLAFDISNIFPDEWRTEQKTINIGKAFYMCSKLTGTAPADLLWASGNTFIATEHCFFGVTQLTNYADIPADWK